MKNKTTTYKWAYLPFVFSSAAILAAQATAGPSGSQRYQDARQVNSINHEYVGGTSQIGVGVDDEGNVDAEFNQVISESDNHSTGVGLWAGYDLKGDNKGILGRGGQVNHAWVSRDASGRATHVNKTFAAYDRNEVGHDKATIGYGQENENLFWDGRVSKGLSGGKDKRTVNGNVVTDRAYDWGVGATVGKFLPNANARIRAGVDHEWSNKVGSGEKNARNTTLSAGIEKFFQGTGHSLSLDVAGSKNSGGYRFDGQDDTDVTGRLGYKYDFGGSSIYQPDRRYRRVREEVPGQAVAPRYAQKQQYKKVPTYKTVPVYGNKTVRTPYKQLVKSTMELEGQTFFKLNSAKLIPSAKTRLKQIASQIRKTGYKGSIRITGNTCGLGNARYDQILSEKRAKEVRNFLIKNGFNPNHLIARGLGKGHPKYPRTPDQDFKNRRVDIEYVSQQQAYKTGHKSETKRVQTGTRRVATGFKNVPAGMKNVMISNGRPGAPRVIWKTEAIPTSPAWIKRALHNNIQHDRGVNTYTTTFGNEGPRTPENTGPVAHNDSTTTSEDTAVTIDVLDNDKTNSGSTQLTIDSVGNAGNGTVTIVNGQIQYTPNIGYTGTDSFTYTIKDSNGLTETATVTITVEADVKPEAKDDIASTVCSPITIDVLSNDNGDSLNLVSVDAGNLMYGTVMQSGNQITYKPSNTCGKGNTGVDNFSYTIIDGNGNSDSANVKVTVKGLKGGSNTKANMDDAMINSGESVTLSVLSNDAGNGLRIIAVDQPASGHVTFTNNKVTYTPNAGFTGSEMFYYDIVDENGYNDSAMIIVDVVKGCPTGMKCN
ncbi:MAG: outer membrane protein OmpA-like peptidoglycan-associated protein [Cocleimonas sp.]|jgi:outer membrane protein OmpA-like peptidoglycan-associated protein